MIFQYRQGHSLFHRIDPLSKFIWLLCVSIAALSTAHAGEQLLLLIAVLLKGIVLAGLSWQTIWRGIRFPFWFGLPYFALQLLFLPGETALARIGGIVITIEAFDYAAAITLRLLTLVLSSLLFIVSTDPRDIVLLLAQKLRVPYRFAYAVLIAFRFIPILESEAAVIRSALRMRGQSAPGGLRSKLSWHKQFALKVFISTVRKVERTAIVMELKGFGASPRRTYRRIVTIPLAGIALSCLSVAFTVIFIVW